MFCELCAALGNPDALAIPPADQSDLAFQAQTDVATEHDTQLFVPRFEQIASGGNRFTAIANNDDEAIHGAFPDAFA